VGRRKRTHSYAPPRLRFSHGAWYHVVKGKWSRLSDVYATALIEYAKREAQATHRRDIKALLTAFIAHGGRAATTQKGYKIFRQKLDSVFGHLDPSSITLQDARRYLDERGGSMGRNEIQLLSSALTWGAERGWLVANPLLGWRKGPVTHRKRYITDAEYQSILAHARPDVARAVAFLYQTGLRVRDALALRWSDVKADGLHVTIHKTKTAIVLEGVDLAPLKTRSVVSMHLLTGTDGRPLSVHDFARHYKAAAVKAGCPDVTIHDIRRKRLTDLTNAKGIEAAQALAGHMDQKTTQGYYSGTARVRV
jgi:integrase